jgi:hypothetical protein
MIKIIVYNKIASIICAKYGGFKIMVTFRFQKTIWDLKAAFHILFIYSRDTLLYTKDDNLVNRLTKSSPFKSFFII